jgi:gas vesicle protein
LGRCRWRRETFILNMVPSWKETMSDSSRAGERDDVRKEIRDALRSLRKEAERVGKDLQTIVDSTQKFVETMTPVVSSTIEDSMEKASEAFKRTMNTVDQQTRPQQARILENYKVFLERQLARVEKRLSEVSKK